MISENGFGKSAKQTENQQQIKQMRLCCEAKWVECVCACAIAVCCEKYRRFKSTVLNMFIKRAT